MESQIHNFKSWIFDMDGTLTVACHDFDAIREKLGLPEGVPILEALATYPEQRARQLHQQLYAFELDLAHQARPQPGADELLERLFSTGHQIGILTRNSLEIAFTTLKACGLSGYFKTENILGRESCVPKPDPVGVLQLIKQWGSCGEQTVMVGDYLFDLQSGHAAGANTIHFDINGDIAWPEVTHYKVQDLNEITMLLKN